ncbi:MAG: hypothetical protein JSV76_07340 [Candidatus Bathyarchaeota archaeon]|nr:MAG: hypothetical protein JSV76_07340 [Candidatus Bathyarchaeota archaeon]
MTDRLDIPALRVQIKEFDAQAETLMEQQNTIATQAANWLSKREGLHQQAQTLRSKRKLLKTRRDQVNARVKKLKMRRSKVLSHIEEKQRKLTVIREKTRNHLSRTNRDAAFVKRQLKELEWEIQTRSFSLSEESRYMDRVKKLEEQLVIHRAVEELRNVAAEDIAQIELLRNQSKEMRIQIVDLAAESQQHHTEMLEIINKLESIQKKADIAHMKYLECRKTASDLRQKYLEIADRINGIEAKINLNAQARHQQQFNEKATTLSETAYKKLKAKKKVTFEEFKLLRKRGLI